MHFELDATSRLGANKIRSSSLDLSRFIAAFIVLMGHFLFADPLLNPHTESIYLSVLHTGFQCVDYFFCLSGFVLTLNSTKKIGGKWLRARLIRLMPVYWVCWISPLLVYLVVKPILLSEIGIFGLILSATASQSLSRDHFLDGPNSPLWSLSVEVWLSVLLIPVCKIKSVKYLYCLFGFLTISSVFVSTPIVRALPYFLLGVIAAKKVNKNSKFLSLPYLKLFCGSLVLLYWIVFPIISLNYWLPSNLHLALNLISTFATLIYFYLLNISKRISVVSNYLGMRSYVIYACHAPILFFYSQAVSTYFSNDISTIFLFPYVIIGIALIAVSTEIIYRSIELKAISMARARLSSEN